MFGQQTAPVQPPSFGGFGQSQAQSQPKPFSLTSNQPPSLFPNQQAPQQQQQAQQPSLLFQNQQPSSTTSSSLFQSQQQQKPSLFQNQNQQQQQQPSLFQNQPQVQAQPSILGSSVYTLPTSNQLAGPAVGGQSVPSVVDQLQKIKDSWDPTSPNCAFQCYFYNKVPQEQALVVQKPLNDPQDKWDQAMTNRPDSTSIPVRAVGFSDLQQRVALQTNQVQMYRTKMHEINDRLNNMSQQHDIAISVKIAEMKAKYTQLVHKTLKLAIKLQVMRSRNYPLRPDEEFLKKTLTELLQNIDDPATFGRITEVWARMRVLREKAKVLNNDSAVSFNGQGTGQAGLQIDWQNDDDQLESLASVLKAQQEGIQYLAGILAKDEAKVAKLVTKP